MKTELPVNLSSPRHRRRRRWKKILFFVLALMVLLYLVTASLSYYVAYKLIHPVPKPVTITPAEYQIPYQSIAFPSRTDGLMLHGWILVAPHSKGRVVIMAHGYRDNRSNEPPSVPTATALYHAGFSVIMFDFRAEGNSSGKTVSVGIQEPRDFIGAVDYALAHGYQHIGAIGYSMGASVVLESAAEDNSIQAVIADSPFDNLHTYLEKHMSAWTHLPNWPFTSEILFEMRVLNGLSSESANPLEALAKWQTRPLMLIAGTADTLIPMSNSEALYNEVKANPNDSLWVVPGATHIGAYEVNPTEYERRVTQFFKTHLR